MKKNTKTICFVNNKGGSGKTTTCSNIGYGLSVLGKRVLMIDGDMQMNLSLSFLEEEEVLCHAAGRYNLYEGIKREEELTPYILPTKYEGVDLVPSSSLMSSIEYDLFQKRRREHIFESGIENIRQSGVYDYILIDAPPTLGGWVTNVLLASDHLIIPVEASPWGLFGLANMFDYLEDIRQKYERPKLLGIAVTKVDTRKNYVKQTVEALKELADVRVFDTCIRVDSAIEWAQDNNEPVMKYKKSSRSAKEYMELAEEIVKHA